MSGWPMGSSYSVMLQNPRIAFRDAELQQCEIRRSANQLPHGVSGTFAVVYEATLPDGRKRAVRAFTSDREERAERYQMISDYLSHHTHVSSLVSFQYTERAIRAVDGKWYPLVIMEWVEGQSLFDWVQDRCREGNCRRLAQAAESWIELIAELGRSEIAHGDLQHGNVLVTPSDELKLVDYDCMCVPPLLNRRNLEIGVVPYQHPDRNKDTLLTSALDDFSALFIYAALRALAASPDLWQMYVEANSYDKLLFQHSDLASPDQSSLYQSLLRSPEMIVPALVQRLAEAYRGPLRDVPRLDTLLAEIATHRSSAAPLAPSPTAPVITAVPTTDPALHDPYVGYQPPPVTAPITALVAASSPSVSAPVPSAANRQEQIPGVAPLISALRVRDSQKFCEAFDIRTIRDHAQELLPYRDLIERLTTDNLLNNQLIGLRPSRGRNSVSPVPGQPNSLHVRWMWPQPRFAETCILGAARKTPELGATPDNLELLLRRSVTRENYEGGSGVVILANLANHSCQIVVWAVIDLGFRAVYGEPLILGRIQYQTPAEPRNAKKKKWW